MLITAKDIFKVEGPFLIELGDGSWRVAREIHPHPEGIAFVEPFDQAHDQHNPSGVLPGDPWHVGENVWEMDYSARIMTLDHPHLHPHPAWQLWLQWRLFLLDQDDMPPTLPH